MDDTQQPKKQDSQQVDLEKRRQPTHDEILAMVSAGEPHAVEQESAAAGHGTNDRIVALMRDPQWLYVYWELKGGTILDLQERLGKVGRRRAQWILRLDDGEAPRDTAIDPHARATYINVQPGGHYQVAIGMIAPDGTFHEATGSEAVDAPRADVSDQADEQWPLAEAAYERTARAFGAAESSEWAALGASRFGELAREHAPLPPVRKPTTPPIRRPTDRP